MTTTEEEFIDAINADPENTILQLVYADWLENQGSPLAEAWRVMIELGKRPMQLSSSMRDFYQWFIFSAINTHYVLPMEWFIQLPPGGGLSLGFFNVMLTGAVGWVKCYRDEDFSLPPIRLT